MLKYVYLEQLSCLYFFPSIFLPLWIKYTFLVLRGEMVN